MVLWFASNHQFLFPLYPSTKREGSSALSYTYNEIRMSFLRALCVPLPRHWRVPKGVSECRRGETGAGRSPGVGDPWAQSAPSGSRAMGALSRRWQCSGERERSPGSGWHVPSVIHTFSMYRAGPRHRVGGTYGQMGTSNLSQPSASQNRAAVVSRQFSWANKSGTRREIR